MLAILDSTFESLRAGGSYRGNGNELNSRHPLTEADELSKSAPAYKHASLDSKTWRKDVAVLFPKTIVNSFGAVQIKLSVQTHVVLFTSPRTWVELSVSSWEVNCFRTSPFLALLACTYFLKKANQARLVTSVEMKIPSLQNIILSFVYAASYMIQFKQPVTWYNSNKQSFKVARKMSRLRQDWSKKLKHLKTMVKSAQSTKLTTSCRHNTCGFSNTKII